MGITVIQDTSKYGKTRAVLIDNTRGMALSPVFGSKKMAEDFLQWLDEDPRALDKAVLEDRVEVFSSEYDKPWN